MLIKQNAIRQKITRNSILAAFMSGFKLFLLLFGFALFFALYLILIPLHGFIFPVLSSLIYSERDLLAFQFGSDCLSTAKISPSL